MTESEFIARWLRNPFVSNRPCQGCGDDEDHTKRYRITRYRVRWLCLGCAARQEGVK